MRTLFVPFETQFFERRQEVERESKPGTAAPSLSCQCRAENDCYRSRRRKRGFRESGLYCYSVYHSSFFFVRRRWGRVQVVFREFPTNINDEKATPQDQEHKATAVDLNDEELDTLPLHLRPLSSPDDLKSIKYHDQFELTARCSGNIRLWLSPRGAENWRCGFDGSTSALPELHKSPMLSPNA